MTEPTPTPQYESGGGKLIAGAAILVVAALSGIIWSLTSRQQAPQDAPPVKSRFLPPSERQNAPTAVAPAPTPEKPAPVKPATPATPLAPAGPTPSY